MLTGYGRDPQPIIPSMENDCYTRSKFLSSFRLSNSDHYGLSSSTSAGVADDGDCYHQASASSAASAAAAAVPRVSISDEELYQALNISPIHADQQQLPHIATTPTGYCSPIDVYTMIDINSGGGADYCYPSTSSLEQTMSPFDNQAVMYLPADVISPGPSPTRDVASPTFSINSFAPTASTVTAEEEDLEVELINRMKPDNRNNLASDIDIFLHSGTSDNEFHSSLDTYSESSSNNPTPSSRLPYAKKLSAASSSQKTSVDLTTTSTTPTNYQKTTEPLFLQTALDPTGFTPLLTPKSDAILQRKLSEASKTSRSHHRVLPRRRESYPESTFSNLLQPTTSTGYIDLDKIGVEDNVKYYQYLSGADFDETGERLKEGESVISTPERRARVIGAVEEESDIFSDIEIDDKSEVIAVDVVEKLFDGSVEPSEPKKPRNTEHDLGLSTSSYLSIMDQDDILDDWETVNDDVLTERMEKLLKDVKKTADVRQQSSSSASTSAPSTSDWDPNFLPHVLEVYGIPDYKMEGDVLKALEMIGYGDCNLKWFERKIVLAVFESASRAKACLSSPGHDWLRIRSLASSPKNVQNAAKEKSSQLGAAKQRRSQTNASVARRMVENVLGMKSTASIEQRKEERKQLNDAKNAKKNAVQWD